MRGRTKLIASLKKYGWLKSKPLSAWRNGDKRLIVKDGQHRLLIAEDLGIPVPWVEEEVDYSTAEINNAGKNWVPRNWAEVFAEQGKTAYREGLEFVQAYDLPVGVGFALLGGTSSYSNVEVAFKKGTFKIKDRVWAETVASLRNQMIALSPSLKKSAFTEACMALCRVKEFDPARLVQNARRCRERLVSFSTRDAYLTMLEDVYNFGRHTLFGLKAAALTVMKERGTIKRKQCGTSGQSTS